VLHKEVHFHWTLNATVQELAMLYRLDSYVGWFPESFKKTDQDKFWVKIWKAWWACCLYERELWDDDIQDLICFLQRIMAIKYDGLVQRYSTYRRVQRGGPTNVVDKDKLDVKEIRRKTPEICEWIGHINVDGDEILGYLTTTPFSGSVYAVSETGVRSIASAYAQYGYKGISI
jgi:hypothetical protein